MKKLWLIWLLLSATLFACPGLRFGDLDCSGRVDLADLAILAQNWMRGFEMSYPNKLQVSGTLDPDVSGMYIKGDDLGESPAWYKDDAIIYYNLAWQLTIPDLFTWTKFDLITDGPIGDYEPTFNTTGTATVTAVPGGGFALTPDMMTALGFDVEY